MNSLQMRLNSNYDARARSTQSQERIKNSVYDNNLRNNETTAKVQDLLKSSSERRNHFHILQKPIHKHTNGSLTQREFNSNILLPNENFSSTPLFDKSLNTKTVAQELEKLHSRVNEVLEGVAQVGSKNPYWVESGQRWKSESPPKDNIFEIEQKNKRSQLFPGVPGDKQTILKFNLRDFEKIRRNNEVGIGNNQNYLISNTSYSNNMITIKTNPQTTRHQSKIKTKENEGFISERLMRIASDHNNNHLINNKRFSSNKNPIIIQNQKDDIHPIQNGTDNLSLVQETLKKAPNNFIARPASHLLPDRLSTDSTYKRRTVLQRFIRPPNNMINEPKNLMEKLDQIINDITQRNKEQANENMLDFTIGISDLGAGNKKPSENNQRQSIKRLKRAQENLGHQRAKSVTFSNQNVANINPVNEIFGMKDQLLRPLNLNQKTFFAHYDTPNFKSQQNNLSNLDLIDQTEFEPGNSHKAFINIINEWQDDNIRKSISQKDLGKIKQDTVSSFFRLVTEDLGLRKNTPQDEEIQKLLGLLENYEQRDSDGRKKEARELKNENRNSLIGMIENKSRHDSQEFQHFCGEIQDDKDSLIYLIKNVQERKSVRSIADQELISNNGKLEGEIDEKLLSLILKLIQKAISMYVSSLPEEASSRKRNRKTFFELGKNLGVNPQIDIKPRGAQTSRDNSRKSSFEKEEMVFKMRNERNNFKGIQFGIEQNNGRSTERRESSTRRDFRRNKANAETDEVEKKEVKIETTRTLHENKENREEAQEDRKRKNENLTLAEIQTINLMKRRRMGKSKDPKELVLEQKTNAR